MSNRVLCREASHAGSWYTASGPLIESALSRLVYGGIFLEQPHVFRLGRFFLHEELRSQRSRPGSSVQRCLEKRIYKMCRRAGSQKCLLGRRLVIAFFAEVSHLGEGVRGKGPRDSSGGLVRR
ncbi:UNVERIFIED_CONTAM: hypothetical protein K2H54_058010 [Gekko kuhli]